MSTPGTGVTPFSELVLLGDVLGGSNLVGGPLGGLLASSLLIFSASDAILSGPVSVCIFWSLFSGVASPGAIFLLGGGMFSSGSFRPFSALSVAALFLPAFLVESLFFVLSWRLFLVLKDQLVIPFLLR